MTTTLNPAAERGKRQVLRPFHAFPFHAFWTPGRHMIRFIFRLLGLMLIALAFILFVYDGTRSIAGNKIFITQLRDVWSNVHQNSLLQLQPALEHIAVWLWDPVALTILAAASWLVLAIIGAVLILLGRKKKPLIGYARD